jgi:hypothetical protein
MTIANCPSCGSRVEFKLGGSIVVVCDSCRSVVARTDRAVEDLGKVAALVDTASPLHVGLEGRYEGKHFILTGRAQMRHQAGGVWDEWYAAFADGRWGWLAEARGVYTMTFATSGPAASLGQLSVGAKLVLGAPPTEFTVAEIGEATTIAAEGEIPWRLVPGETYFYADLQGPNRAFATLDYSEDTPLVFTGRETDVAALGIAGLRAPAREASVLAASLPCPKCGGPLELKAPDRAERVACPYCDSLLDVDHGNLKYLRTLKHVSDPAIKLGTTGRVQGVDFTVIGYMVRSITYEGVKYHWEEYLLYNQSVGFRWLTCSDDHWSFVGALSLGDINDRKPASATRTLSYGGRQFKIFADAVANVEYVLGEFYWKVEVGEKVRAIDYVAPPEMISKEITGEGKAAEVNVSHGVYVTPAQVEKTFGVKKLRRPRKIGPNQPFPHTGFGKVWLALAGALLAIAFVLWLVSPNRTILEASFDLTTPAGQFSKTFDSSIFELEGTRNVKIEGFSNVSNSWVYVDGVLFNVDTGLVQPFSIPIEYYAGSDWSEGSRNRSIYLPAVPPGRYTLNFQVEWDDKSASPDLKLTVRHGVVHLMHFVLAFVGLTIIPVLVGFRKLSFEASRWSESDFGP